mmetsp:Transcript_38663/g.84381  ORF Transcript_38663/g.84381 Transcript_38663/m.84381 type:complete len:221 (-) Transcript_38663:610-1272(-)
MSHRRWTLATSIVPMTIVAQTPTVAVPTNILRNIGTLLGDSDHHRAFLVQLHLQLPFGNQVARSVQQVSSESVPAQVHAHVVLGGFPVQAAFPLPKLGVSGDFHPWVDGKLQGGEHHILELRRSSGDGVGIQTGHELGITQREADVLEQTVQIELHSSFVRLQPLHTSLENKLFCRIEFIAGNHCCEDVKVEQRETCRAADLSEIHKQHIQALSQCVMIV